MPDLLLEFFSEEIPARMQARAAEDLKKLVTDKLVAAGLTYDGAKAFATPRRLALAVAGIPVRQPDVKEERKGPKVGAPEQAIAGFLRAAGLASIDQAKVQADKKGDFYVAVIEKQGRPTIEVLAETILEVVRSFPWPKSMRWGDERGDAGRLMWGDRPITWGGKPLTWGWRRTWVRPLHSIVATFGPETEEPDIVDFEIGGIKSGDKTRGHRFMAPGAIKVRRFDDYVAKLEAAKVVVDPARRAQMILTDAKTLAFAQGFELVEDEGLLAEVAGLVEWPVVLMGEFDKAFLAIPEEVIRATIRNNQKCFVVRDPETAKLTNKFVMVANIEASDGGKAIITGCERVIRARLSDAKFFYDTDLKVHLEDRLPKFEHIVFHERLGTQAARISRIKKLTHRTAEIIADKKFPPLNVDVRPGHEAGIAEFESGVAMFFARAQRAAELAKADLLTEVVGEFPELQGLMGRYYAEAQGEDEAVAHACEDHYKPKGPDDLVPADPVSVAVALADRIDILSGFWAIDEKPTGSKDPYALRRAALGVIRLILDNRLRLRITELIHPLFEQFDLEIMRADLERRRQAGKELGITGGALAGATDREEISFGGKFRDSRAIDLMHFFADRLKVQLREQGARHDLVDAVFALPGQDDLVLIVRRIEALAKFLDTDDGKNLLAGTKRAANILRIEEKKDNTAYTGAPDAGLLQQAEEKELARAIGVAKAEAGQAVGREDFASAMTAMSKLRPHVDAFFEKVTVNADDIKLRANRLRLLNEIREATRAVADFSKIEG